MLRSVLIALALILPSAAVPKADLLPIDLVARAKFPYEDGRKIDALAAINRFVNDSIVSISDRDHYGVNELWVMNPPDGKGDCEDYSLTKLMILSEAGFPIVTNTKIVGVLVHHGNKAEGHALLAVLMPNGSVVYLDNLNSEPMTRAELQARGYQFFDWIA